MTAYVGCGSKTKGLARNLDSTITNLVYSVTSLDLVDTKTIYSVSQISDLTSQNNVKYNNSVNITSKPLIKQASNHYDTEYSIQPYPPQKKNFKLANATFDNEETSSNSDEQSSSLDLNLNIHTDIDQESENTNSTTITNNKENTPTPQNTNLNNGLFSYEKSQINQDSNTNRTNFENITYSKDNSTENLKNLSYHQESYNSSTGNNQNNGKNYLSDLDEDHLTNDQPNNSTNIANQFLSKNPVNLPSTYTSLTESSQRIVDLINNLVNLRTSLMLYISDLYNGTVELSNEDYNAIMSYINIIKEATAYLKSNNGIVTNHLNEATAYLNGDSSASVANSHIIRAIEALNTRSAKLESAIVSAYNIALIIQNSLKTTENLNNETVITPEQDLEVFKQEATLSEAFNDQNASAMFYNQYNMPNGYNMAGNGLTNYGYSQWPINYQPGFTPQYANPYYFSGMMPYYGNNGYGGYNYVGYGYNGMYGGGNGMLNNEFGYNMPYNRINEGNIINNAPLNNANELNNQNINNYSNYPIFGPINNATYPNVLSGLVSKDNQDHLEDVNTSKNDNSLTKEQTSKISQKAVSQPCSLVDKSNNKIKIIDNKPISPSDPAMLVKI